MKKKMVKRLMAASVAGTLAVTMFAGCGGSSDSKDSSAKTEDTSEDNSDKPDTWMISEIRFQKILTTPKP